MTSTTAADGGLNEATFQSTIPKVFFGGDSALGPKNIIWAVVHGHDAAVSIDQFLHADDLSERPLPQDLISSQKMGIHEWSYDNDISNHHLFKVPLKDLKIALANIKVEVELGFDAKLALAEAEPCLNCDIQTVFTDTYQRSTDRMVVNSRRAVPKVARPRRRRRWSRRSIGSINAVYFDIEVEKGAFRADAKDPMASTTAAAVGFAAEFREPMGSAAWIERVVRGTWRLLGPAGASDTVPGVEPALRPCVREGSAVSLDPSGPAIVDVVALGRTV